MSTTVQRRPVAGRILPTERRADHLLLELLKPVAQRLLAARAYRTDGEHQLLRDMGRDDVASRQPQHTLARLCGMSIAAPSLVDALALSEAIRHRVLLGRGDHVALTDLEAFDREQEAQCAADEAQWRFARRRDRMTREEAIARLERQLVETRAALDALYASPVP